MIDKNVYREEQAIEITREEDTAIQRESERKEGEIQRMSEMV